MHTSISLINYNIILSKKGINDPVFIYEGNQPVTLFSVPPPVFLVGVDRIDDQLYLDQWWHNNVFINNKHRTIIIVFNQNQIIKQGTYLFAKGFIKKCYNNKSF